MLNACEYLTLMAPLRVSLCYAVGLASMDRLVPMGSAGSAEWYSFSRWDSFSRWACSGDSGVFRSCTSCGSTWFNN